MARLIADLLTLSGMLVTVAGFMTAMVLAFWLPYMAWSVTRNIKGIREQLEALNDTLGTKMTITKSGPLGL